jgi:hypothetical protein
MKKFLYVLTTVLILSFAGYFTFIYNATYSEGVRSGQLIKFSHKGMAFKTWEGEISQGISGAQIFSFSVLDKDEKVIADLQELEGQYVKLSYVERYKTFAWWGDTKYFIVDIKKETSPYRFK